ncbi:MAG: hypothetical protein H0V82_11835 [Candidatus Protochlamydia sp.]|nr:hypothetical protein [Candidatus Protochlamydia sp.]
MFFIKHITYFTRNITINNINSTYGPTPIFYSSSEDEIHNEALINDGISSQHETDNCEVFSTGTEVCEKKLTLSKEQVDELISQVVQEKTLQSQQVFDNFEKLSLEEAKTLIHETIKNRIVNYLSPFNIVFVDMIKVVQQLNRDPTIRSFIGKLMVNINSTAVTEEIQGSEVLHEMAVELHLLFRCFREYSCLIEGKTAPKAKKRNILEALEIYLRVVNLYVRIESLVLNTGTYETKNLCRNLKKYCDVLYYACHNEDILKICSKSLSPDMDVVTSVLKHPPSLSHMNLYLDSLDNCLFSLVQFQLKIKSSYHDPLTQAIHQIRKIQNVTAGKPLNELIESILGFQADLNVALKEYLGAIQKIVIISKSNKNNQPLKACFENLLENAPMSWSTYDKMIPLIVNIMVTWQPFNESQECMLMKLEKQVQAANQKIKKSIEQINRNQKNKTKSNNSRTEFRILLSSIEKLTSIELFQKNLNALVVESGRIPMLTMQEMFVFFSKINIKVDEAKNFQQSVLTLNPYLKINFPCSSFSPLDLLIFQIFQCYDSNKTERDAFNDQIKELALKLLPQLIQQLTSFNSIFIKNPEANISNLREITYYSLEAIIQNLKRVINQETNPENTLKKHALKLSKDALVNLLVGCEDYQIFLHFLTSFLLCPMSTKHEISLCDLPLIQQQMEIIGCSAHQMNILQNLINLENVIKEREILAPPEKKIFWKLNLKHVTLAKLEIKKRQDILDKCNENLQICLNHEEALDALHHCAEKLKFLKKSYAAWSSQIMTLSNLAIEEMNKEVSNPELYNPLFVISTWDCWVNYLKGTIEEIVSLNAPQKLYSTKLNRKTISVSILEDSSSDSEEASIDIIPSNLPQETYQLSSYERRYSILADLKKMLPPILNELEPIESLIFRSKKRNELIQNSFYYLALIEEAKGWNTSTNVHEALLKREQIDHVLLLEATEKIALISLRIGTKESPNLHIFNSNHQNRSLMYTHNGELLTALILSANKQWYEKQELEPWIKNQDILLKKSYWFKEDQPLISGVYQIDTCCEKIWHDLIVAARLHKDENNSERTGKFLNWSVCIQKLKINQEPNLPVMPIQEIDLFMPEIITMANLLQFDPQCHEYVQESIVALKSILQFNQILFAYNNINQMPLFFAARSAEIQVGLISLSLILSLSTFKSAFDQPHPLLLDDEGKNLGRPFFHTHRIDKLWNALKLHCSQNMCSETIKKLDKFLPLFVGDPRYPYPNKTAIAKHQITLYEKVYLYQKFEQRSWFSEGDKKLLSKHTGKKGHWQTNQIKEILKEEIGVALEEQKNRTLFALHLAKVILAIK